MIINFSPTRSDEILAISVKGDAITINEQILDLRAVPKKGTLRRDELGCKWLASDVERIEGEATLTIILPHGPILEPGSAETTAITYPRPLRVSKDGPLELPKLPRPEIGGAP